jgi:DNA-binding MarR family transcriptional regulator
MVMIVNVTRTMTVSDPTDVIIVDFRATMTRMKCASSERLVRLGVSMAQLNILYTLQRSGDVTMSQLADVLNVSLSNASGLIDRMEERDLVERTRVLEDRRIVMVQLTPSGTRLLEEVDALSDELLRSTLARLDPTQLAGIAVAVADLRIAVEAATAGAQDRYGASTLSPRSPSSMPGADLAHHHPRRD